MTRFITLVAGVLLAAAPALADWNSPGKSGQDQKSIGPGDTLVWTLTTDTPETTEVVQAPDCNILRLHSVKTGGTLVATSEICAEDSGGTLRCGTTGVSMDGTATVAGQTFSAPVYKLRVDITTCSGGCDGAIILTCGD